MSWVNGNCIWFSEYLEKRYVYEDKKFNIILAIKWHQKVIEKKLLELERAYDEYITSVEHMRTNRSNLLTQRIDQTFLSFMFIFITKFSFPHKMFEIIRWISAPFIKILKKRK